MLTLEVAGEESRVESLAEAPAALRKAMAAVGLDPGWVPSPDGEFRRFYVAGDRSGTLNGYVCLDPTARGAVFGTWKVQKPHHWVARVNGDGSAAENVLAGLRDLWEAERQARQQEAETRARRAWATADGDLAAVAAHPYLVAKGVAAYAGALAGNARVHKSGTLLVARVDATPTLRSLAKIHADGRKRNLDGGRVDGLVTPIGGDDKAGPVYLCEGVATGLSVHAATGARVLSVGSCKNLVPVARAWLARLAGRRVIIAADADSAGNPPPEAREAAALLGAEVRVPATADTDWNDVHQAEGLDAVRRGLEAGPDQAAHRPAPDPLLREAEAAEAYPVAALGPLAAVVQDLAAGLRVPPAMAAQSVLATTALAVQGVADVHLDGRVTPLSLFCLTVGESGVGKSTTDRPILAEVQAVQKSAELGHRETARRHQAETSAYAQAKSTTERAHRDQAGPDLVDALMALGPEPVRPPDPVYLVSDTTFEGLYRQLRDGRPSVGLFNDEGALFLSGWAMNAENAARTVAGLNRAWDGSPLGRSRVQEGGTLYGRRVSLHLLMQPGVAGRLFGDAAVRDIGFLWRSLVAWPDPPADVRYNPGGVAGSAALAAFQGRLRDLLRYPLPLAPGSQNELAPRPLGLSQEALGMFIGLFDQARAAAPHPSHGDGPLTVVRPYAMRAGEHGLRLAGVLTLYQDPEATTIQAEAMDGARRLVAWYLREMLRIHEAQQPPAELVQADRLLRWAHREGRVLLYPRLIYQFGPYGIRTKAAALRAVTALEAHGWLIRIPEGAEVDGAHRRDVWRVVATPEVGDA
jgi:phage/plasmid primase-like uncharacterized protein